MCEKFAVCRLPKGCTIFESYVSLCFLWAMLCSTTFTSSHTLILARVLLHLYFNLSLQLDFSMPLLEMPETGGNASLLFPHRSTFMSATTTFMDMTPAHGNADVASYGCLTSPGTVSDGTGGFTPVKLPLDACVPVSPLLSPNPAWSLGATMDARVPQVWLSAFDRQIVNWQSIVRNGLYNYMHVKRIFSRIRTFQAQGS